jgi:hypothetical protein
VGVALRASPAAADTNLVLNATFGTSDAPHWAYWTWHPLTTVETCCGSPNVPHARVYPDGTGGKAKIKQTIANPPPGQLHAPRPGQDLGGPQQAWIKAASGLDDVGKYCQTTKTNTTVWTEFSCPFSLAPNQPVGSCWSRPTPLGLDYSKYTRPTRIVGASGKPRPCCPSVDRRGQAPRGQRDALALISNGRRRTSAIRSGPHTPLRMSPGRPLRRPVLEPRRT